MKPRTRTLKPWTKKEERFLQDHASKGAEYIAAVLERSVRSVVCKASEIGVSLRRPGCRKGLRLGQPRNVKITEFVKHPDLAESLADPKQATEIMRIVAEYKAEAPLCPACGDRPQTRKNTGLCDVCYYERLTRAWREGTVRRRARADYLAAKEQGKRRTICTECGLEYSPRLDREGRKSDRTVCPECRQKGGQQ